MHRKNEELSSSLDPSSSSPAADRSPQKELLTRPCPVGEFVSLITPEYRYASVNPGLAEAHRVEASALIGRHLSDIWGANIFEGIVRPHVDRCLKGRVAHYRSWFQFPKTGRRYWEVSLYPYRESGDKVTHAMVVTRDITEQERAANLIHLQRKALEAIARDRPLASIFDGIREDLEEMVPGVLCVIMLMDRRSQRLRICSAPEFACASGAEILEDLEPGFQSGSCGHAALVRGPALVEDTLHDARWERLRNFAKQYCITSALSVPFLDESGEPQGTLDFYYTFGNPVEDSHRDLLSQVAVLASIAVETRIAEDERLRLSAAIEQSGECVAITDVAGRIQYTNPAYRTTVGKSKDELEGREISSATENDSNREIYKEVQKALARGETWTGVLMEKPERGDPTFFDATAFPVHDAEGRIDSHVWVRHDITEKMNLEIQLRQAQKMEAVGRLAGGVAHDFNNLLQAVLGYAELARSETDSEDRIDGLMAEILKAGRRGAQLVKQLLTFSRSETIHPEILDLNLVVHEMMQMLRQIVFETVGMTFSPHPLLKPINASRNQVEQVLLNLCVNARDAMPEGGELRIATGMVVLDSDFCARFPWTEPGEYAYLQVSDNGTGIPYEIQDRIFEPFFTTKEVGKGTGLGLATVYGIVKQHKGVILVESRPGEGTEVRVYLPTIEKEKLAGPRGVSPGVSVGEKVILLADYDPVVRELTGHDLEIAGYRVLICRDGEEALRVFESHLDEIHLAILEIALPKLSGGGLYHRIRSYRPALPIVLCSSPGRSLIDVDFSQDGYVRMLRKPFKTETVLEFVKGLLEPAMGV